MRSMLFLMALLSLKGGLLVAWWVENVRYVRRLRRMAKSCGKFRWDHWPEYAPARRSR